METYKGWLIDAPARSRDGSLLVSHDMNADDLLIDAHSKKLELLLLTRELATKRYDERLIYAPARSRDGSLLVSHDMNADDLLIDAHSKELEMLRLNLELSIKRYKGRLMDARVRSTDGSLLVNHDMYADDLVIEADSKEFGVLLRNRDPATKGWGLTISPTKTKHLPNYIDPKPADLIEISRWGYQHWAIYVGDGYVVHITSDGMCSGVCLGVISCSSNAKAVVRRDKLVEVVGTDKWKVNNKLGNPLPVAEILESCRQMVNKKLSYNICKRNCEHFVTNLRFGQPRSKQADTLKAGAGTVGILGTILFGVLSFLGNKSS